jgi:hypothetical protein
MNEGDTGEDQEKALDLVRGRRIKDANKINVHSLAKANRLRGVELDVDSGVSTGRTDIGGLSGADEVQINQSGPEASVGGTVIKPAVKGIPQRRGGLGGFFDRLRGRG